MYASRTASVIAGLALAGAICGALLYDGTRADELSTICAPGYARSHRLPADRYYPIAEEAYRRAGVPWSERHTHILDHVVPLELGGGWSQDNLQVQTIGEASRKDALENRAHDLVCAHRVPLEVARSWFKRGPVAGGAYLDRNSR